MIQFVKILETGSIALKTHTMIGIILIIPFTLIMISGLGLAIYDLQTSEIIFNDPNKLSFIPYEETEKNTSFNLTLNEGKYWFCYVEGSENVTITLFSNNEFLLYNLSMDPDNDFSFDKNGSTYFVLDDFYIENISDVIILKKGEGGFYLTPNLIIFPDRSLVKYGMGIGFGSSIPFFIVLIWLLRGDKKKVQAMKEIHRRNREELKKVRFDPRNPKQVAGAFLIFVLGPMSTAFVIGMIPLYFTYDWIYMIKTLIIFISVFSFIFGFLMFYNKNMLGPGGALSFKQAPPKPNGIDFFYECVECGAFTRTDHSIEDGTIRCSKCGKTILFKEMKYIICPICSSSLYIHLDPTKNLQCPFCFSEFNMKYMAKKM